MKVKIFTLSELLEEYGEPEVKETALHFKENRLVVNFKMLPALGKIHDVAEDCWDWAGLYHGPVTHECWVNLYSDGRRAHIHFKKEFAESYKGRNGYVETRHITWEVL